MTTPLKSTTALMNRKIAIMKNHGATIDYAEYRDKAWTAMVIWENMLADNQLWSDADKPEPMNKLWQEIGTNEMRNLAIDLEPGVNDVFKTLGQLLGDDPLDSLDLVPFDWEFVPFLLRQFVKWGKWSGGADFTPDVLAPNDCAATIIAMRAHNVKRNIG